MRHEETLARASRRTEPQADFSGEWANPAGSTMDIVQEQGVLTGVYACKVSDDQPAAIGQLSGYAQGDLISVTAKWDTMAITTWVGRRRTLDGEDVIETLWHTVMVDGSGAPWPSIHAGADRFSRATMKVAGGRLDAREAGQVVEAPAIA